MRRLSILSPNLESHVNSRVLAFALAMQDWFEIQIVGPKRPQKQIWSPLLDFDFEVKTFEPRPVVRNVTEMLKNVRLVDGDVTLAITPCYSSFSLGLIAKFVRRTPLVLDMLDWETGFHIEKGFREKWRNFKYSPNPYFVTRVNEHLIFLANEIIVTNSFLQHKFGGILISHLRDSLVFDPNKYDSAKLRKECSLEPRHKVVAFLGTPKPHKGITDLIEAIHRIQDPNIILLVIGVLDGGFYSQIRELCEAKLRERNILLGLQPFNRIPELLAMTDLVVIPQRKSPASKGQIPAKLIDAMMMGKPIIATDLPNIVEALGGCGVTINTGDIEGLSNAIKSVLEDENRLELMGESARRRALDEYSFESARKKLIKVLGAFI